MCGLFDLIGLVLFYLASLYPQSAHEAIQTQFVIFNPFSKLFKLYLNRVLKFIS